MKPEVEIYDTTLRDGSQGEGINFSVMDKLRIAEKLDAFGVHYIEGGWPGSNPKDIEFFAEAKRKKFKRARLAAFGSTRRKGVPVESDDQVRLLPGRVPRRPGQALLSFSQIHQLFADRSLVKKRSRPFEFNHTQVELRLGLLNSKVGPSLLLPPSAVSHDCQAFLRLLHGSLRRNNISPSRLVFQKRSSTCALGR